MKRRCGPCAVCCDLFRVEGMKQAGERCKNQCAYGCAVHDTAAQPEPCKTFKCAWLSGALPKSARPDKTKMVCYASKALGGGRELIECQTTARFRSPHRATFSWLMRCSENVPVIMTVRKRARLFRRGKVIREFESGKLQNISLREIA